MSVVEDRIKKKKVIDYKCPECGHKLDLINHREPRGILDYTCRDACMHIIYDATEDKWYNIVPILVEEPEKINR